MGVYAFNSDKSKKDLTDMIKIVTLNNTFSLNAGASISFAKAAPETLLLQGYECLGIVGFYADDGNSGLSVDTLFVRYAKDPNLVSVGIKNIGSTALTNKKYYVQLLYAKTTA